MNTAIQYLPSLANGVEKVAFSDATIPSVNVADVTLEQKKQNQKINCHQLNYNSYLNDNSKHQNLKPSSISKHNKMQTIIWNFKGEILGPILYPVASLN